MQSFSPPIRAAALVAGIMLAATAFLSSSAATATAAQGRTLTYTVLRDGDPVGRHVVNITGDRRDAKVAIKTDVVVKFAFIPVYHFNQTSSEEWRRGRLATLKSVTDDDGEKHRLSVHDEGGRLIVDVDDNHQTLPSILVPASLWNPALVEAHRLLNTIDGHSMAVKITEADPDRVKVHGRERDTRHYVVSGDLERELWYDHQGTLVRVRFAAKDNSHIDYVLE